MTDTTKFYGIWTGDRWVDLKGDLLYDQSRALVSAKLANLRRTDGRFIGEAGRSLRVAIIPEDGGKPADE